jgi:predicted Fe-S protein YdhL (DUF1289 family)
MAIESPCIRNCCLDELDVCLGCGRTLDEITGWTASDDTKKTRILDAAKRRCETRASCLAQVANKYGA